LLSPVKHRSAQSQADLTVIRARAALVRVRTGLVNSARSLAEGYGERLRGCNVRNMNAEKAKGLSSGLHRALEPLLAAIESVSGQIVAYNQRIEQLAVESYPQVALLRPVGLDEQLLSSLGVRWHGNAIFLRFLNRKGTQ